VVDLGQKPDLGRSHGIVVWEEELEVEDAALIGGLGGSMDLDVEVAEVVFVGNGGDAWNSVEC
jgi:hypothetical protein